MATHSLCYKICTSAKWLLFLFVRYPVISRQYLKTALGPIEPAPMRPQAPKSTIKSNCCDRKWPTILIVVSFFCYAVRNATFVLVNYSIYDHFDLESNLIQVAGGGGGNQSKINKMFRFVCMETNCSELIFKTNSSDANNSNKQLAYNLNKLPIFSLCNQEFDSYMTPVTRLGSFGLLAFAASAFTVFLLGASVPIQQFLRPANDETLMFLAAPEAVIQLLSRKCQTFAMDLALSYGNFCSLKLNNNNQTDHTNHQPISGSSGSSSSKWSRRRSSLNLVPAHSGMDTGHQQLEPTLSSSSSSSSSCASILINKQRSASTRMAIIPEAIRGKDDHHQYKWAAECLPLIRSTWWHARLVRFYCFVLVVAAVIITSLVGFIFVYINKSLSEKSSQLIEHQRQINELKGCKVWTIKTTTPINESSKLLDLSEISTSWSMRTIIETLAFNYLPGLNIAIFGACYYAIISEISLWLAELRGHLLAWLTCCKLYNVFNESASFTTRSKVASYKLLSLNQLQRDFRQQIGFIYGIFLVKRCQGGRVLTINSDSSDTIWAANLTTRRLAEEEKKRQDFLAQAEIDSNSVEGDTDQKQQMRTNENNQSLETLEQMYIQFRLFIEHVQLLSPGFTLLLNIVYLFNFGLLAIGVFFSSRQQAESLVAEPVVLISTGWLMSNIFIVLAANFHANTKKLQMLIWSLVAQLAQSEEPRAQHMRLLWTKQMFILDLEGDGIALRAHKIRITYVNLIQLLIWTATILVIALKPH